MEIECLVRCVLESGDGHVQFGSFLAKRGLCAVEEIAAFLLFQNLLGVLEEVFGLVGKKSCLLAPVFIDSQKVIAFVSESLLQFQFSVDALPFEFGLMIVLCFFEVMLGGAQLLLEGLDEFFLFVEFGTNGVALVLESLVFFREFFFLASACFPFFRSGGMVFFFDFHMRRHVAKKIGECFPGVVLKMASVPFFGFLGVHLKGFFPERRALQEATS